MTLRERIESYVSPQPHSVQDFVRTAFIIDEEHRSGDITTVEMGGRFAMLAALYRDLNPTAPAPPDAR